MSRKYGSGLMPNADAAERAGVGKGRAALGAACLSDHFPRIGFLETQTKMMACRQRTFIRG